MPLTPTAMRSARVKGRITMGGRGVPYRFGSRPTCNGKTQQATIDQLHTILSEVASSGSGLRIDHAWCGVLGVPRDWCTTVGLDPETRIAWAGGYVGLGVSSSNLSGRTLTDLILGRQSDLVELALGQSIRSPVGNGAASLAWRPFHVSALPYCR